MQVTFKNTGMIEDAGIELNGLTVIAGENDTGKSTVGKLLFAFIPLLRASFSNGLRKINFS
ncbi:MAG: hypothetical protein NT166_05635 [Candidatus Aminicenantes bacterium]|nr:hypothetical protein [Candidatus Aminicenantes bacterium]